MDINENNEELIEQAFKNLSDKCCKIKTGLEKISTEKNPNKPRIEKYLINSLNFMKKECEKTLELLEEELGLNLSQVKRESKDKLDCLVNLTKNTYKLMNASPFASKDVKNQSIYQAISKVCEVFFENKELEEKVTKVLNKNTFHKKTSVKTFE